MTIYLGSGSFVRASDQFQIQPPLGFGAVDSCRISNLTVDILILTNIQGDAQSTEYLMPFQQMVYRTVNISAVPTMAGVQLGPDIPTEQVLVEWSTSGDDDFIGTYPTNLTVPPGFNFSGNAIYADRGHLADGDSQDIIRSTGSGPHPNSILGSTVVNEAAVGSGALLLWGQSVEEILADEYVTIQPGSSLTFDNGASFGVMASGGDVDFSLFGEQSI